MPTKLKNKPKRKQTLRIWTVVSPSGAIWPQYSWTSKGDAEADLDAHFYNGGLKGALASGYKIKRATIVIG